MVSKTMKNGLAIALLLATLSGTISLAQDKVFDWVHASDEAVELDPADVHAGRTYRPGPNGGNMHVDIRAKHPVTVSLVPADEWYAAARHDGGGQLDFRCTREHIISTTYTCSLLPSRPMVLVIRDERTPSALVRGIGVILQGPNGAKRLVSPNDIVISYYRWDCVNHCEEPEFQWFTLAKEKYELTPVPKVYSLINPDRDGEPINVRVKSPVPMLVTVIPARDVDQIYADPAALQAAIANSQCKQRGVQKLAFGCNVMAGEGQLALVLMPEPGTNVPSHKKAEIELDASQCVSNCNLLPPPQQPDQAPPAQQPQQEAPRQ